MLQGKHCSVCTEQVVNVLIVLCSSQGCCHTDIRTVCGDTDDIMGFQAHCWGSVDTRDPLKRPLAVAESLIC